MTVKKLFGFAIDSNYGPIDNGDHGPNYAMCPDGVRELNRYKNRRTPSAFINPCEPFAGLTRDLNYEIAIVDYALRQLR